MFHKKKIPDTITIALALLLISIVTISCQGEKNENNKNYWQENNILFDYKSIMIKIPGGEVVLGSNPAEEAKQVKGNLASRDFTNESPVHSITIKPFYLEKYEVTIKAYSNFIKATGRKKPKGWDKIKILSWGSYPIVNVSWEDANAYAHWAGKRLPTEAEWELAARGRNRNRYPWGNTYTKKQANFPAKGLLPIGSNPHDLSISGIMDLAGNVAEWVADTYLPYGTTGASTSKEKVIRGNSFGAETTEEDAYLSRGAHRDHANPEQISEYVGFRCALDSNAYHPPQQRVPSLDTMIKIPAGSYISGTNPEEGEKFPESFGFQKPLYENESPEHNQKVAEFYLDQHEVTIGEYKKFMLATKYFHHPWRWEKIAHGSLDNFPVPYITWEDAAAYAQWSGKRLPTEFEWEKAARGTDKRLYPWGNSSHGDVINKFKRKILPVGTIKFDRSPYGLWDMGANVAEWTASYYTPFTGNEHIDLDYGKKFRVIKGGANIASGHYRLLRYNTRAAYRSLGKPHRRFRDVGFRCAYSQP